MPDPFIVEFGFLKIRWYGALIALAILLGTFLALKEVRKKNINEDHFMNMLLLAMPAAFIGARLYYVAFNWGYYKLHPSEILAVWQGGLAIHGGLIGAFTVGWLVLRYYKINFLQVADLAAPSLILGQAIGRWGNYFNQEAYGYEVDPSQIPWAMWIDGAYRHPAFLYESIWNLLVFSLLIFIREKIKVRDGFILSLYLIAYSVGRFFIEGLRTDSLMLGPLRMAQVTSLSFIFFGLLLLYWTRRRESGGKF